MSSQTHYCKGFEIEDDYLVQCFNELYENYKYCEVHEHKYRLEKPEDCAVCMEQISEQTETPLECGHWFHKQCLIQTNKQTCPMCRQPMYQNEIDYIFSNEISNTQNEVSFTEHDFSDYNYDEIIPNIGPNHDPFYEMNMNENDIETMINEIETSPRNNSFVNVQLPLNIIHPSIEEDFEYFVENTIERISLNYSTGFEDNDTDMLLSILSNSVDRKIFAISYNLLNRRDNTNNNFNNRMLSLMEHSILFTYNNFF